MGLLDQLGDAASGALGQAKGGGVKAILIQQLVSMLSKPGALASLTSAFQNQGLSNVLQSWIGSGANLPISPDQVRSVLGDGNVKDLAARSGLSESETSSTLSGLLPEVIDKVTPDGKVPAQSDLSGMMSSLGKLLG